jgi:hypothetical protein
MCPSVRPSDGEIATYKSLSGLDIASWIDVPHWLMSERSSYLRDQAAKCRRHANAMSDAQTQQELLKLAAEYIMRAAAIENVEARYADRT